MIIGVKCPLRLIPFTLLTPTYFRTEISDIRIDREDSPKTRRSTSFPSGWTQTEGVLDKTEEQISLHGRGSTQIGAHPSEPSGTRNFVLS